MVVQVRPRSFRPLVALGAVVLLAVSSGAGRVARAQADESSKAAEPQGAGPQGAEPQETIARIVELNRDAIAQYHKKHFETARKMLKQALALCEGAALDHHPVAARTRIHLGIVIVAGFGQREIGGRQFNEALQIDPNITLTPGLATPAVEDVFNEALAVSSPSGLPAAASSTEPSATPARADDGAAESPPSAPARADDEPAGTPPPPAPAAAATEQSDDEAPRAERRAPAKREGDDEEADGASAGDGLASHVQLAALLGAGAGWTTGMGDVNANVPVPGSFAAAKLGHVELAGGYWLTDEIMLGLEGRFQIVTGATEVEANNRTYHPATYATAVFATGAWSPDTGRLRPYVSAAVGAGRIRHEVTLAAYKDCGPMSNEVCIDTVGAGPFLAGVGGGVTYDLGERFALIGALNTQIGAPTFTFNVDLNAGVAFRL